MRIIIAGAGEVGTHLAKLLSNENQDIIVIDEDNDKLDRISSYNLMTFCGRTTSFKTLSHIDVGSADLFIAVTPYETENLCACEMAKFYGAKRTVARIDNYEYLSEEARRMFRHNGVDELIYPEYYAAREMAIALEHSWVRHWFELCHGALIVVGVKMRDKSRLIDTFLYDLPKLSDGNFHVSVIKRKNTVIIPRGSDTIKRNDIVYFVTTKEYIEQLRELCGKTDVKVERIMIMGGSRIAIQLVYACGGKYNYRIVEQSRERARMVAEKLDKKYVEVIYGDGRDIELLKEEGISDCQAFVALTGSSETNILGCLTAKSLGCQKTIAEVETIQFINEAENLNIGTVINKKLQSSSKIFQLLLDFDTSTDKCLALSDAEVAEIEVHEGAKITKDVVKHLSLPSEMTLAGLTRNGIGQLIHGDTQIQAGDHVVVFCLNGGLHKIERLFS